MLAQDATILLVEDDEIDIELVERAFRSARIATPIVNAKNGEEALQLLRSEGKVTRPYTILLDLNLPKMNGFEFLDALREDEHLANSVVFVLTTSNADGDKRAAYEKQVAGYILKTNVGKKCAKLVSLLEHYWKVVELPPDKR